MNEVKKYKIIGKRQKNVNFNKDEDAFIIFASKKIKNGYSIRARLSVSLVAVDVLGWESDDRVILVTHKGYYYAIKDSLNGYKLSGKQKNRRECTFNNIDIKDSPLTLSDMHMGSNMKYVGCIDAETNGFKFQAGEFC